jgi:hypothetical protein
MRAWSLCCLGRLQPRGQQIAASGWPELVLWHVDADSWASFALLICRSTSGVGKSSRKEHDVHFESAATVCFAELMMLQQCGVGAASASLTAAGGQYNILAVEHLLLVGVHCLIVV